MNTKLIDKLINNYALIKEYKEKGIFNKFTKNDWFYLLKKDINYLNICSKYKLNEFTLENWNELLSNYEKMDKITKYLVLKYYLKYVLDNVVVVGNN